MPNWCSNSLELSGPKDKIKALWNLIYEGKKGMLELMVPLGDWEYDKAVNTWGTKWDIDSGGLQLNELDDDTASITGSFESAWSPPIEALQTYCDNNEDVKANLRYFEPGMSFVGEWDSVYGDECYEIDPANLDNIPETLREDFDLDNWYAESEA